jgi:adenylate kinase
MVLFFGPPGSGKSVQGQLLVARNGWSWLSTGELFRKSTDPKVLAHLASGELIDNEMTNKVLHEALRGMQNTRHIVLDGYPRNTEQAKWLVEQLPNHKRSVEAIVVFDVSHEELTKRLSGRGRDEDNLEVIKRRLEIYDEQTQPVLDFFETQGVPICRIDGHGSVGTVHDRIQAAIETCALL